jgi:hypothetical protein
MATNINNDQDHFDHELASIEWAFSVRKEQGRRCLESRRPKWISSFASGQSSRGIGGGLTTWPYYHGSAQRILEQGDASLAGAYTIHPSSRAF